MENNDIKDTKIGKSTFSNEQHEEMRGCSNIEDNDDTSIVHGYNMAFNYSSDNCVDVNTSEVISETEQSGLKCCKEDIASVMEIKSGNNNDTININSHNQTNEPNSIDHNYMSLESSDECFNVCSSSMQCPLRVTDINPASNDFTLIEDKLRLGQKSNLNFKHQPTGLNRHSDHSTVISNSNAEPVVEQFISTNHSLAQLATYGSDESLHEESPKISYKYREPISKAEESDDSDSDSSSSSSSTSVLVSDSSDIDSCEEFGNNPRSDYQPVKAKGELDLDDLPPIEDLKISVSEDECILIGKVFQIVDKLVVIQAMRDKPAYDLDTVLFVEGGQPLGKIFDVFGPVAEPFYSIRFNSIDHIKKKNITLDQMVYSAPKTKYTKFVFVAQLMKIKGSDASWKNDEEPPEIYLDYSDDEQEQRAKKNKFKNKKAVMKVDLDPDEPARKKHFAYERRMNERNLEMSGNKNHQNTCKTTNNVWHMDNPNLGPSTSNTLKYPPFRNVGQQMFGNPPIFNTQIPPPHAPFPNVIRSNMSSVQNSQNNIQYTPHFNRFMNSNNSQATPTNCPLGNRNGIEVPNLPSFTPPQFPQSLSFGNQSSNPNWNQPSNNNVWPYSSPSLPVMESHMHTNNRLPSSAFWIQRPTFPHNPNIHSPIPGLRNMYVPSCPPRLWPMQNIRNNITPNNQLPPNYIPYAPPPSPNAHHF